MRHLLAHAHIALAFFQLYSKIVDGGRGKKGDKTGAIGGANLVTPRFLFVFVNETKSRITRKRDANKMK